MSFTQDLASVPNTLFTQAGLTARALFAEGGQTAREAVGEAGDVAETGAVASALGASVVLPLMLIGGTVGAVVVADVYFNKGRGLRKLKGRRR